MKMTEDDGEDEGQKMTEKMKMTEDDGEDEGMK